MMIGIDNYQDLEYPDKAIKGFRNTALTWDMFKDRIDFSGKTVFDIGCATGYFLLKSFKMGAKRCIGIDLNGLHNNDRLPDNFIKPLDEATKIFNLWGFKNYNLIVGDWEDFNADTLNEKKLDIVFCMNVIHYWKDELKGLEKVFLLNSDIIVFEIRVEHTKYVKNFSVKYEYEEFFCDKSHWNGSDFIILKKQTSKTMLDVKEYKIFNYNRIPKTVYIFDINGTLDCSHLEEIDKENAVLIPTKKTFEYLRDLNTWVGTWSGMYPWMQLQILNGIGVEIDFSITKNDGLNFKSSILHIYKVEPKIIIIGNTEEDSSFAHLFHFDYLHRDEFIDKHKNIIM